MSWLRVSIETENPDAVCDILYSEGIDSVEIEDADSFDDFLENNKTYWDYVDESVVMPKTPVVSFYTDEDWDVSKLPQSISALAKGITSKLMDEEDWENNWKEYYKPLHIGKSVVIKPFWEEYEAKPSEKVVVMDPGAAFGTGSHETTSMCIEMLENYITPQSTVLDIGCGSGILAVTACVFGANSAVAVDIDPLAVKTTMENAELNGVEEKITAIAGNLTEKVSGKFPVVVANIVADVIISLCQNVYEFMADDGVFICSGIISDRADDVKSALISSGFEIISTNNKKDWYAFSVKRKTNA